LIDLVLIAEHATVGADRPRRAIDLTFSSRSRQDVPMAIPALPRDWVTPYRVLATETGLDPGAAAGHTVTARFLDPILGGTTPPDSWWDPLWADCGSLGRNDNSPEGSM
jgi:hypothetical protein